MPIIHIYCLFVHGSHKIVLLSVSSRSFLNNGTGRLQSHALGYNIQWEILYRANNTWSPLYDGSHKNFIAMNMVSLPLPLWVLLLRILLSPLLAYVLTWCILYALIYIIEPHVTIKNVMSQNRTRVRIFTGCYLNYIYCISHLSCFA